MSDVNNANTNNAANETVNDQTTGGSNTNTGSQPQNSINWKRTALYATGALAAVGAIVAGVFVFRSGRTAGMEAVVDVAEAATGFFDKR